jgi:hypothetical protein
MLLCEQKWSNFETTGWRKYQCDYKNLKRRCHFIAWHNVNTQNCLSKKLRIQNLYNKVEF